MMHVFQMDDEQYYAARNLEEAQAEFTSDWGKPAETAVELTGASVTFRAQLEEETHGEDRDAFLLCLSGY